MREPLPGCTRPPWLLIQLSTQARQGSERRQLAAQGSGGSAAAGSRLHGQLADLGDSELVLTGLHEHALGLRYMDTQMLTTAAMCRCGWHATFREERAAAAHAQRSNTSAASFRAAYVSCEPCMRTCVGAASHPLKTVQPGLSVSALSADCLAQADMLSAAVHRRSDFSLLKYLPSSFLRIRSLVGWQDRC